MLLEQIQRHLAQLQAERAALKESPMEETHAPARQPSTPKGQVPAVGTVKTIGVQVDAATYAALVRLMQREQLKSIKAAALVAIQRGTK